jgi:hypothetical protein
LCRWPGHLARPGSTAAQPAGSTHACCISVCCMQRRRCTQLHVGQSMLSDSHVPAM